MALSVSRYLVSFPRYSGRYSGFGERFGERWNVLFNSAIASLNRTFHLSPHENILTIALINIH